MGLGEELQHVQAAAAHLLQDPPDLRLKEDEQGQDPDIHDVAQEVVEGPQPAVGQPQRQQHHQHALEKAGGVGAPHQLQQAVDQEGDHQNIQHIPQAEREDKIDGHLRRVSQDVHGFPSEFRIPISIFILI